MYKIIDYLSDFYSPEDCLFNAEEVDKFSEELIIRLELKNFIVPKISFAKVRKPPDFYNLIGNVSLANIVSEPFRQLIDSLSEEELSYYPVKVYRNGNEPYTEKKFYYLHLPIINCIDLAKSGQPAKVYEEELLGFPILYEITNVVIDPARVPPGLPIFTLPLTTYDTVVTDELAAAIQASDLKGIRIVELHEKF